jgi:hypothetical protein
MLEELESSATEDELVAEMAAQDHEGGVVHAQATVPQAVPGASAPRTRDHTRTDGLRLLRRRAAVQRMHHTAERLV